MLSDLESIPTGRFATLMERWRQSLGLNNQDFASRLGRGTSEWSQVQRGRRPVTRTMAARVLAKAEEPWRSAFERALVDDVMAAEHAHPKTTAG